jgi:hypothetical protein
MSEEREPLLRDDEDDGRRGVSEEERNSMINGKFTLLEKALFALSVVLLISVCTLAGLYGRKLLEDKPNKAPSVAPPRSNHSGVSFVTPRLI